MRILLVSIQLEIGNYLKNLPQADQWTIMQYSFPLKAIDNLLEIAPEVILWNYNDFPRHWKVVKSASALMMPRPRFFLVSESPLTADEQQKAEALGVDFIGSAGFFADELADRLTASVATDEPTYQSTALAEARLVFTQATQGTFVCENLVMRPGSLQARVLLPGLRFLPTAGVPATARLHSQGQSVLLGIVINTVDANGLISCSITNFDADFHQVFRATVAQ
jgi:hypothetical protein